MLFERDEAWRVLESKYGLCHCVYSTPADAWVLLSHCCVEHGGGKQQDSPLSPASLYLSSPNTHTLVLSLTSKQPLSCTLQHTCNHPQRGRDTAANRVLLDGGPVGKRWSALEKPTLSKYSPGRGAWPREEYSLGPSVCYEGQAHSRRVMGNVIGLSLRY